MKVTLPKIDYTNDELSMIKDKMSNCLDKFIMEHNSPEVRKNIEKDIMDTLSDIISDRRDRKINKIL